jgi:DNA replication initiation complex subunit (GINS family)
MDEEEINYKVLRKIQQMEKNSPTLTKISSDFYDASSNYLKYLNDRLEKEKSSQKGTLLRDEIQNTDKIITNIYEHREKKILLAAVTKVRSGNPNLENLLEIEKNLFDSILQLMTSTREDIIKNKSKSDNNEEKKVNEIKEGEKEQGNINPIVMVKEDIPEFIGTDMKKYNLRKGDIISLPKDMNDTLSKRDVVKEVKQ